jgi:uncharacterized protein (TIGR02996 family)
VFPEDALLKAVIAEPDDDSPRLIYADWLEENGQEERAEFIRVQVALWKANAGGRACGELRARSAALLREHDIAWARPFHWAATHWTYDRGFIRDASCELPRFVTHAEALFRHAPLQGLHLRHVRGACRVGAALARRASHRSGRAQLRHPARPVTASLPDGTPSGLLAAVAVRNTPPTA